MMRITAQSDSAGAALSAGRAFFKSVGPGWLIFDAQDDVADMLFVATVGRGDRSIPQTDLVPTIPKDDAGYILTDHEMQTIIPGLFETSLADAYTPEQKEQMEARTPLRRLGDPSEIGHAALFLSSDASAYITGTSLVVDGGSLLKG